MFIIFFTNLRIILVKNSHAEEAPVQKDTSVDHSNHKDNEKIMSAKKAIEKYILFKNLGGKAILQGYFIL